MQTKDVMQMSRTELVEGLRYHLGPRRFQIILMMPTADMRGELARALSPESERRDGGRGLPTRTDPGHWAAKAINLPADL